MTAKKTTPARPARAVKAAPEADEAAEGEVLQTPRQKLEERRAQNADRGLAPRRPQDRRRAEKKRAFEPLPETVEVEFHGFLYEVDPSILDNWELLEAEADGTLEELSLPDQYRAMLGNDGYEELKDNVRSLDPRGRLSARIMAAFMQAVQEEVQGGNS